MGPWGPGARVEPEKAYRAFLPLPGEHCPDLCCSDAESCRCDCQWCDCRYAERMGS